MKESPVTHSIQRSHATALDGVRSPSANGTVKAAKGAHEAVDAPAKRPRGHALILANRLPWPLDDGWKVRTFHVLRGIALRARVTMLVFHPDSDAATADTARTAFGPGVRLLTVDPPRAYGPAALLRGISTRYPVHVWNQESAALRQQVRSIVEQDPIDFVVAESTFMARYLDLVPAGVPRLIDTHNIDSVTFSRYVMALRPGLRRAYAAVTVRKLAAFESATYRASDGVWVCSEIEREMVSAMAPGSRVWTVPNGVDTTFFDPAHRPRSVPDRILFFGRLDYYPNIDGLGWFAREILPRIQARRPDVELQVVGAGAGRDLDAIAALPGVRLIGRVADIRDSLGEASVVVAPLRVGGGTRLKILEALSMGRSVVSTSIGAEGLDVENGVNITLADDPETTANAVVSQLADPVAAARLGDCGRSLVRERYDWTRVDELVAASLEDVALPLTR
jgi:sugar transferase (PEP-CTERM/EpsH1 system associated)